MAPGIPGYSGYRADVGSDVSELTVTVAPIDAHASIEPATPSPGVIYDDDLDTPGLQVHLDNRATVRWRVRAQNRAVFQDYTVSVYREHPPGSVARLRSLELDGLTLTPEFSSITYDYEVASPASAMQTIVTAIPLDPDATIEYLDSSDNMLADANSTDDGHQVALDVGDTVFKVKVTAEDNTATQTYTVTVTRTAAPSDDCAHVTTTTCEVDVGGSVTGNVETAGDSDWFKVVLEAGTRYQIDLEGADTGRGTLPNPSAILYNRSSANVAFDVSGGVGDNARVIYTPTAAGAHYVQANTGSGTGTYTLSVIVLGANGASEADTDFPNNNTTSGRVAVGASATGNVESATDVDRFRVDLEADKQYQFDLEGAPTGRGTLADPFLSFGDSTGTVLDFDDNDGDGVNSRIVYTATATGTYYLRADKADTETGTYTLSVREVPTAVLPTLSIVNKSADEGEAITFPLSLSEATSENVAVTCTATFGGGDTAVAEDLTFTSANGRVQSGQMVGICLFRSVQDTIVEDNETFTVTLSGVSSNAQLATDPTAKGTILDDDVPPVDDSETEEEDLAADTNTTGTVEVGGSAVRGDIYKPVFAERTGDDDVDGYSFDTDWLAVDLKAGRTYRIDMEGATPGADSDLTLRLPEIEAIYDADSNYLPNTSSRDATDDANSSHHLARVEFTPHEDGTYYIAATGESFEWGSYELTVIDITQDDDAHPADRSTTGHAALGTPVTGKIDFSGDVDWFRMHKISADIYQINLEGQATGRGSLRDPLLRGVYDADGNYISGTRNDDGGEGSNAWITFDLPVGIYYIAVGAFGNGEGTYTLTVSYY